MNLKSNARHWIQFTENRMPKNQDNVIQHVRNEGLRQMWASMGVPVCVPGTVCVLTHPRGDWAPRPRPSDAHTADLKSDGRASR